MDPTDKSAEVIVRYKNGYALHFFDRGYEVVEDAKATKFTDRFTADKTAREHGLRADQFEIGQMFTEGDRFRLRKLFADHYNAMSRADLKAHGFNVEALVACDLITKSSTPGSPNYFQGPALCKEVGQTTNGADKRR
jgi:hypothetical protein